MAKIIPFLNIFLISSALFAKEPKASAKESEIKIESLEVKIFDRQKGLLVENGKQSDPYGLQNDLFVNVKLSGVGSKEIKLKVTVSTPKSTDEARGETKATLQSSSTLVYGPDPAMSSTLTVPFLFQYQCNPMTIAAEVVGHKVTQKISIPFHCAE